MQFKYNHEKNAQLLLDREIGLEEIICAIADGNLLAVTQHYNPTKYPNQKILYVRILEEVYVVPYIQESDGSLFLKTLFRSRKARQRYFPVLQH